jgi:hypothetical protein
MNDKNYVFNRVPNTMRRKNEFHPHFEKYLGYVRMNVYFIDAFGSFRIS